MKRPFFHSITRACIHIGLLFLCQSVFQLSHAQYNIVIKKVSPSVCFRGGEAVDIYGSGFGKKTTNKILIFTLDGKEYLIDKIEEWNSSKISAVIPKVTLTNKERSATIGIRIRSTWASNRDRNIRFCSQLKTASTPFNTQVNRELRAIPTKTPFSSTLSASPANGTVTPEGANEQDNTPANTRGAETVYIAENTEAPTTPRVSGSLTGLGTPPKVNINITPNKAEREQQEAREIMVISASMDEAIQLADLIKQYNIRIKRRTRYSNLGTVVSILGIPDTADTATIIQQLREYDPNLWVDFNHRYRLLNDTNHTDKLNDTTNVNPKQWAFKQVSRSAVHEACSKNQRIGIIDTGISPDAALAHAQIREKSFIPNGVSPANKDHGTAIGSLLLGSEGTDIIGLTPQATLYSAAIFRQRAKNKSDTTAEFILAALNWLAGEKVGVINMSLGGPRNLPVELAIKTLKKRGITVIASAGVNSNKKPLYPAAQAEVVAVRATDINQTVFNEQIQGDYIDFSAPGVDLWLLNAKGKGKYMSGSSFASPFIAASFILKNKKLDLNHLTEDLGEPGKDPLFGLGFVSLPSHC
ncbi:MAG: S8 family serine peptidase [Cellvibrionaceae bacterium]